VTIGADSHKRTHTLVAVDETGRKLAEKTAPATTVGHLELVRWAERWPDRTFALEDCRHLSRRLERDLLFRSGERQAAPCCFRAAPDRLPKRGGTTE
jgi:transposase